MSPEFMLRPSLSACESTEDPGPGRGVLPEFMLRPSLSVAVANGLSRQRAGVAGVYAPAFVERV